MPLGLMETTRALRTAQVRWGPARRRSAHASRRGQRVDREVALRVSPDACRRPAGAARERTEGVDRVLVAVFGVDGFAGAEFDRASGDLHLLTFAARKVHFDATALAIVESVMTERVEIEVGSELAVDARKQVEVEFRGDTRGVVVGSVEDARVLDEVDTDDQRGLGAQHAAGMAKESAGVMRFEIADGRTGEEAGPRQLHDGLWQPERLREVGCDRHQSELRVIPPQLRRLLRQHFG